MKNNLIADLLTKQIVLDASILAKQNLDPSSIREQLMANTVLAFEVELAELANELRTFKHWSKKGSSEFDVYAEEYVDALHFLLSLTYRLEDPAKFGDYAQPLINQYQTEERFNKLKHGIGSDAHTINLTLISLNSMVTELYYSDMYEEARRSMLLDLWDTFIFLGYLIGIDINTMVEYYLRKNAINYRRQEEGY